MRARSMTLAAGGLLSAACAAGPTPCATPGTCPDGQECLANRCVPEGNDPVPAESHRLVLRPTSLAWVSSRAHESGGELPTAVTFGSQVEGAASLYLRFEPAWRAEHAVVSAFLLLDPMGGALPSTQDVTVEAWRVKGDWEAPSLTWLRQPETALPQSAGLARTNPPTTLRIDVTDLIRYLKEHPHADRGIVLKAAGDGPHGASFATGAGGGLGPRLELYSSR